MGLAEDKRNETGAWQTLILEQGISQLGQAMLIVSGRREVVFMSKNARQIIEQNLGLKVIDKRLTADIKQDDERLNEALNAAVRETNFNTSYAVYIHRQDRTRPIHLTISRMPKFEEERRANHYALVLIKDLNLNQTFWADRLKEEYKLSPREMECVSLLSEGRDLKDVAELMNIGIETVRQYMKSIYSKMGVHKQHELVSLALEYKRNR